MQERTFVLGKSNMHEGFSFCMKKLLLIVFLSPLVNFKFLFTITFTLKPYLRLVFFSSSF